MNASKFESTLIRQDESKYIYSKCNAISTMNTIDSLFGPFRQEEIDFVMKEYNTDINPFQKILIFNMFYKYFGDPVSPNSINKIEYIKLMIAAKRILKQNYMVMLPYVLSARVEKLVSRKTVNKKEMVKLEMSPNYDMFMNKYRNEKIKKQMLSFIATIISSDFRIIDFDDPKINGKKIEVIPDLIIEEMLMYGILV